MKDFTAIIETLNAIKLDSDDPDTQTAAIIWGPQFAYIDSANCLPPGVKKTPERISRPDKYDFIGHAERGAINKAAREGVKTWGARMALNWFPCVDCAIAIVQAGIVSLYCDQQAYESRKEDPRYKFDKSMAILTEGGVEIEWF
jgi:dCMP deaminase